MHPDSGSLQTNSRAPCRQQTSLSIGDVVKRESHVMQAHEPMAKAYGLMWAHRIRHVPVMSDGRVVGVVSEADLQFARALRDIDPGTMPVQWVMTPRPCVVDAEASLLEVAQVMEQNRHNAVVVVRGSEVLGVFTVVDALRALCGMLTA